MIIRERRITRIIIKRVELEDDGEYMVEVSNSAGKTETTGRVTVQDKRMDQDEDEDK